MLSLIVFHFRPVRFVALPRSVKSGMFMSVSTFSKPHLKVTTYSLMMFPIRPSMSALSQRFWKWTSQNRPLWRESPTEAAIIFTVFGLAGSSSVSVVRPVIKHTIGLDGPFMDYPMSYIFSSILIGSPAYACIVFTIGTLAGRHIFFANMARKVVGRFLPSNARDKIVCTAKSNK